MPAERYDEEISERNPALIIFLVDQSGSMDDPFGRGMGSKAQITSDAINKIIHSIVLKITKGESIKQRFFLSALGYGHQVGPAFEGEFAGQKLVSIRDLASKPVRIEERKKREPDGAGGVLEISIDFPVWLPPKADGTTPMCQAVELAKEVVATWLKDRPESYPPIIINITDGAVTDGDPRPLTQEIAGMANGNGSNPVVLNCHITHENVPPIEFPTTNNGITDKYALVLFDMSSVLPQPIVDAARADDIPLQDGARGFVFNADTVKLVEFLNIGTRPAIAKAARELRPGQEDERPGS